MGQSAEKASRRPRADSLRNRERLLEAARSVFSAGGPDASLEAVARTAEVGIGTLYRHFPTREALFQAVYKHEVDQLVDLASEFAASAPPTPALRQWLHAYVGMVATKKGMLTALAPATDGASELYAESAARLQRSAAKLMDRGAAAGAIRTDVTPEELMRALNGMCYTREQPGWREIVIRLVDIFLDGLSLRPGQ